MDNNWFRGLQGDPTLAIEGTREYQRPQALASFKVTQVWQRIQTEAAPDITSVDVFDGTELEDIEDCTGARIVLDKTKRIIHVGAASSEKAEAVVKKLDNLFNNHQVRSP